jgi:hypothetical protein
MEDSGGNPVFLTVATSDSRDERRDHGRTDEQHADRNFNIGQLR